MTQFLSLWPSFGPPLPANVVRPRPVGVSCAKFWPPKDKVLEAPLSPTEVSPHHSLDFLPLASICCSYITTPKIQPIFQILLLFVSLNTKICPTSGWWRGFDRHKGGLLSLARRSSQCQSPTLSKLAAYSHGARLSSRLRSVSATTLAGRAEGRLSIHGSPTSDRVTAWTSTYCATAPPEILFSGPALPATPPVLVPCANFGPEELTKLDHPRQPANVYLGGDAAEEGDSVEAPPREP